MVRYLVSILLFLSFTTTVYAGWKLPRRVRDENDSLKAEIVQLRATNDSLRHKLEVMRNSIDSLSAATATRIRDVGGREPAEFELSDSLLHTWYSDRGEVYDMDCDIESDRFDSKVSDSVFVSRLEALNSYIHLDFNPVVKNCCILYSERMSPVMERILGDCRYYWPMFDEIFSHYGLPLELKAMVIVESMLRPTAESRMGAKGIWQFMYTTARGYGLLIDSWTDERMDPVKSTDAAARYLRDAYAILGDWPLAIASYNCGMGNINKAVRRSGGKRTFWEIYDFLPRETRGYFPAFIGALYATHYYNEYGLAPVHSDIAVPVDTFHISRNLHFDQIEAVAGIPGKVVAALNPQYFHNVIPGDDRTCVLRVPVKYSNAFLEAGDSLYLYQRDSLLNPVRLKKIGESGPYGSGNRIVYRVQRGDVLGKIARRYGVTVSQIRNWNHLSSTTIRIGQKLVIYCKP